MIFNEQPQATTEWAFNWSHTVGSNTPVLGKGTYRLTVGKDAWKESTKSLVHPVDVIFDSKLGVYKLRTPVIDIHKDVMSKRN